MAYIGNAPVIQSTEFREEFFPTSNQTAFITGGFHPSAVSVTRNGVLLSEADYTKDTDNVTITLNSAAISGDVVVIRGNRSLAQGVSVSESRVEYTWQSGDTVVQLNADVIPAYTDVYLNGVKLAAADYSINASTKQVSFTSAPAVGDVIAVVHRNETSALVGLPLKDSSGAEILSESGSTVTLANVDTATIGSNALVVDSSGNVGIGGSPTTHFEIQKGLPTILLKDVDNTDNKFALYENSGNAYLQTYGSGTNGTLIFNRHNGTTSTESMRIDKNGNITTGGITSAARGPLHVHRPSTSDCQIHLTNNATGTDSQSGLTIYSNTTSAGIWSRENVNFRVAVNNSEKMRIDSSGALILTGSTAQKASGTLWTNPSDIRLKDNITNYSKGISELNQIQVKQWEYNGKAGTVLGQIGLGVIADEIESVLPNTVDTYSAKLNEDDETETDIKNFDATEILWLLVNTCKEQQTLIESQQSQIDALTARIEALEAN